MKKLLIFLFLIIALVSSLFLKDKFKPQENKAPAPSKITLTYSFVKANQMPVIVAKEKGLFKKYNIDVNIKEVDKNVTSVITSGKADIMIATPNIALTAAVAGQDLLWIGSINNDQSLVVVSTKDIKDISSAGVIIGPARAQTIGLLKLLNVNTENITFKDVGGNQERLIALEQKQVDVIHAPKTDWLIFKQKAGLSDEYKVLLDSAADKRAQLPIGIMVRGEFLKNNKEAVEGFTKALIEANNWIENNKESFIKLAEKHFSNMPKADAAIHAKAYTDTLSGLEFTPTTEKGNEMLDLVTAANPKAKDYNINNFISRETSDSLKKSGFLDKFTSKSSKIKIAYININKLWEIPMIVASQKGLFKKYNIDPQTIISQESASKLLAGGKVDAIFNVPYPSLLANIEGANLSWAGTLINNSPVVLVSAKDPEKIETVAVYPRANALNKANTIKALKEINIDSNGITFEEVNTEQIALASLIEKRVDAVGNVQRSHWQVFSQKNKLSNGYKILVDTQEKEHLRISGGLIVRSEFLKNEKTTVENFSKALLEAASWTRSNKKDTVKLLAGKLNINDSEAEIYVNEFITVTNNLTFAPNKQQAESLLKDIEKINPKAKDYNIDNFIFNGISDPLKSSGFLEKTGFN